MQGSHFSQNFIKIFWTLVLSFLTGFCLSAEPADVTDRELSIVTAYSELELELDARITYEVTKGSDANLENILQIEQQLIASSGHKSNPDLLTRTLKLKHSILTVKAVNKSTNIQSASPAVTGDFDRTEADTNGPTLNSISVNQAIFDVTDGPQTLIFTVDATDESGINWSAGANRTNVILQHPNGSGYHYAVGDNDDPGKLSVTLSSSDAAGEWKIFAFQLTDNVGNKSGFGDLESYGLPASIEIIGGVETVLPTLNSISVNQTTFDVTDGPQQIIFTVDATDESGINWSAGINRTNVILQNPNGTGYRWVVGDNDDPGKLSVTLSSSDAAGVWKIYALNLTDNVGNKASFGNLESYGLPASIEIIGGAESVVPTLNSISVNQATFDVTDGPQQIIFTVDATDESGINWSAGINRTNVILQNPNGTGYRWVVGDNDDPGKLSVTLSSSDAAGVWKIYALNLTDNVGNKASFGNLESYGLPSFIYVLAEDESTSNITLNTDSSITNVSENSEINYSLKIENLASIPTGQLTFELKSTNVRVSAVSQAGSTACSISSVNYNSTVSCALSGVDANSSKLLNLTLTSGSSGTGSFNANIVASIPDISYLNNYIGVSLVIDPDDDGDGIADSEDNCPSNANSDQLDTDSDGIGNACDVDDDNDNVLDGDDTFPLDATESVDTDGDGIGNNADTDDDGDFISDSDEVSNGTNPLLADTDGDGVNDNVDAFPTDATEAVDTDSDGVGNNADTDDDGDTLLDQEEIDLGLNPLSDDTDNDGISDSSDESTAVFKVDFPNVEITFITPGITPKSGGLRFKSPNSIGVNNFISLDQPDSSENKAIFKYEFHPLTPSGNYSIGNNGRTVITYSDGGRIEDYSKYSFNLNNSNGLAGTPEIVEYEIKELPNNRLKFDLLFSNTIGGVALRSPTNQQNLAAFIQFSFADSIDSRAETIRLDLKATNLVEVEGGFFKYSNSFDVPETYDAGEARVFQLGLLDGALNELFAYIDSDNDLAVDQFDAFPSDPDEYRDSDGDGTGNYADTDDDNDGVDDSTDVFPLDATESIDTDADGIGNNADADDDGDNIPDVIDAFPLDSRYSADSDNDGLPDAYETTNQTDPNDASDATSDYDDDLLTISQEFSLGTSPVSKDTDRDTLPDGWEVTNGRNPLIPDYQISGRGRDICVLDDEGIKCQASDTPSYGIENVPDDLVNPRLVETDYTYACALVDSGIRCWGRYVPEGLQALGNDFSNQPTNLSLSTDYGCVLFSEQVKCIGMEIAVPTLVNPTKVSVGGYGNACAIDDTGLVCWSRSPDFLNSMPTFTANVSDVDLGPSHSCVIDSSEVLCWGSNSHLQLNVPSLINPQSLSVGRYQSCVLDDQGVICWRDNGYDFTNVVNVQQVAVGHNAICLLGDAGVTCVGGTTNFIEEINVSTVFDPDGDGYNNQGGADAFPLDSREWLDTDSDGIGNNADSDDDNDGVADEVDVFPLDASESADTDLDGVGDNADAFPNNANETTDSDSDGVGDNSDNCISVANPDQLDTDGDTLGNACDPDDDNDGLNDEYDALPLDASEQIDTDGDGIGNNADTDDDGDSISDSDEISNGTNPLLADSDGDSISDSDEISNGTNPLLADSDGDGVNDNIDAFPIDESESSDFDGDGIGDNTDQVNTTLTFSDGVFDISVKVDDPSDNPVSSIDLRFGGRSGSHTCFIEGTATEDEIQSEGVYQANFKWAIGNNYTTKKYGVINDYPVVHYLDGTKLYDQNQYYLDLINLNSEAPQYKIESFQTAQTDIENEVKFEIVISGFREDGFLLKNPADCDDCLDIKVHFSNNSDYVGVDFKQTDVEKIANDRYVMRGKVVISDPEDFMNPKLQLVSMCDTSLNGKAWDQDSDQDSMIDALDAFPQDSSEVYDTDSDGVGNNVDTDDDNDNALDGDDAFPLDATETIDTDGDGIGNNADTDDDNDAVADSDDAFPLDSAESSDSDGDGLGDNADAFPNDSSETVDSDSDGIGDNADAFPNDPTESADTDLDGVGDNSDAFPNDASETVDSDSDGTGDNADAFPNNVIYSEDSDSDGMPDEWETRYGLDPNDPSDATSDQDNDGVSALDEFLAGTIPSGSLDIDGNAQYDALTDGLLLLRGMFGLDGSALVTGTIASDATYTESVDIESRIATLGDLADIDGNGDIDALTDGLLTLRYLFGLQGDTLINGVVAGDATRKTAEEIEAHLETLMPAL